MAALKAMNLLLCRFLLSAAAKKNRVACRAEEASEPSVGRQLTHPSRECHPLFVFSAMSIEVSWREQCALSVASSLRRCGAPQQQNKDPMEPMLSELASLASCRAVAMPAPTDRNCNAQNPKT